MAYGKHTTDVIYSDLDIPLIETLPLTQMHRDVDVAIVEASKEGRCPFNSASGETYLRIRIR